MSADDVGGRNDSELPADENVGDSLSDEPGTGYDFGDGAPGVPRGEGESWGEAAERLRSRLDYDVFSRDDVLEAALDVVDDDPELEEGAYRLVDRLLGAYVDGGDS